MFCFEVSSEGGYHFLVCFLPVLPLAGVCCALESTLQMPIVPVVVHVTVRDSLVPLKVLQGWHCANPSPQYAALCL